MIGETLLAKLLWSSAESYLKDSSSIKSKSEIFRELLYQEVCFNLEVLDLIKQKKDELTDDQLGQLLQSLDFEKFESFSQTGIPFKLIIDGKWNKTNFKKFDKRVKNLKYKSELVTRSYHRLKLFKLKEQLGIQSSQLTLNYVIFLFLETKKALK